MSSAILETSPQHQEGARISFSVDLAPGDCYMMCKELFSKLKAHEKQTMIDDYLKSKGISFNLCEEKV